MHFDFKDGQIECRGEDGQIKYIASGLMCNIGVGKSQRSVVNGKSEELNEIQGYRIGLCNDYSYWQQDRCINVSSWPLSYYKHPILCDKTIDCSRTWSNDGPFIKHCENSATEQNCTRLQRFFCKESKACIHKRK